MQIQEVNNKVFIDAFHELPYSIYKNDSNWTPPLRISIEEIFDPSKNHSLKEGDACRWLLMDDGKVIGRIAAFWVPTYAFSFEQKTGGVGFFECIDNQKAANKLFDTAILWLKEHGMEACDGPINIGENFVNWGLLADGFMKQGYGMPYNPKYYRSLFENYGFKIYYKQYSYHLNITSPDLPNRFWKIAEWRFKRPGYTFEKFRIKNQQKFIKDFLEIYEKAWISHDNYKKIDSKDLSDMIEHSKMLLDEDFIWFVYYKGKPVSFFMMVPDFNQLFSYCGNGKLNFFKGLKLMILKAMRVITRCRVLVMGVIPEFQNLGIESAIFYQLRKVLIKKSWYNEMELGWVGDFNPKMISLFESVGGKKAKTHLTYRYLFDRTKKFKRASLSEY